MNKELSRREIRQMAIQALFPLDFNQEFDKIINKYFNKEKIRLIEDLSTATNLNLRNPSLKIHYNKEDTTSVEFKTQEELQAFLREALG